MSQIRSIQAMRAIAAILVTFGHLEHEAGLLPSAAASGYQPYLIDLTGAGVDLFFVISGFVMVYASRDLFERPKAPRIFLLRRMARIVPMYWIMTTIFLVTAFTANVVSSPTPSLAEIVKSYLFIPYRPLGADLMQPVYKLGWTLNYEMFFYALFATMLVFPARLAVPAIAILFAGLVLLHGAIPLDGGPYDIFSFWTHPIILEFVMGAIIAAIYSGGLRLHARQGLALFLAGITGFALATATGFDAHGLWRPVLWGLPAALMLTGTIVMEKRLTALPFAAWIICLGDSSYALYLIHPIIVRSTRVLLDRSHLSAAMPPWLYVAMGLAIVIPVAVLVHLRLERPMTRWLSDRLRAQTPRGQEPLPAVAPRMP